MKEDRDYDEQRKVFSNSYHSYCDADFNSLVGGSTEFSSNCTFDFSIPGNMNDSWLISNKDHALNNGFNNLETTVNDIVSAFNETRQQLNNDSYKYPDINEDDTESKTTYSSEKTIPLQ